MAEVVGVYANIRTYSGGEKVPLHFWMTSCGYQRAYGRQWKTSSLASKVEMCPRKEQYSLSTNLIRKVLALLYHQNRFELQLNHTNMYLTPVACQLSCDPNASGEKKQKEINNRKRNYEQFSQQYARQHYNEKSDVTKVRRNSASSFNNTDIP